MSSILKVDQIQLSNGNTPTAGDLGLNDTGTVLQAGITQHSTFAQTNTIGAMLEITANSRPTLTKKQSGSKILFEGAFNIYGDLDNDSHGYQMIRVQVERRVNGGGGTTLYDKTSIIDRGGQSRFRHVIVQFEDTAGTAGQSVEYRAYTEITANSASRMMNIHNPVPSSTKLTEIAG